MNDTDSAPATDWHFERTQRVRFGECDPAGIVFFPRYHEMLNALVEDWFTEGLGIDYADLIGPRRVGLPTVRLESDFLRVSRMGDALTRRLRVARLGDRSMTLQVEFAGADGVRARFAQVLVCTSLVTHAAQPWPADLRAAVDAAMDATPNEPSLP